MGERIPMKTIRASQATINKLDIFFAKISELLSEARKNPAKTKHDKTGGRLRLMDRAIDKMRNQMFSDGNESVLTDGYSARNADQLKSINFHIIEFFAESKKSKDLSSAKSFSNYLCSLQRSFRTFYEYHITNWKIFHHPKNWVVSRCGQYLKRVAGCWTKQ